MSILYTIGGCILLMYGIWQTITSAKVFIRGEQDRLGADIKILGVGITCIICGIIIILQHV